MDEKTLLEIRANAMLAELNGFVTSAVAASANRAAEVALLQHQLNTANARIKELEEEKEKTANVQKEGKN